MCESPNKQPEKYFLLSFYSVILSVHNFNQWNESITGEKNVQNSKMIVLIELSDSFSLTSQM